jgi:hypothetical protein
MSLDVNTIWRVPAYLPYLQPALTEQAIASIEMKLAYKLPAAYLNLLGIQNGGYIRFSLPETPHSLIAGIGPNFPALGGFRLKRKGLVPFDGDGHWHLCLDFRKDSTAPAVTYIDSEIRSQQRIAKSFEDYLAKLEIRLAPEDYWAEFVLTEVTDIETAVAKLSSALGTDFLPPDSSLYGYPFYQCKLETDGNSHPFSISANLVPRGFVRHNDRRYAELKDLMPGEAVRYPEVPVNGCILTVSKGIQSQIMDACTRCGFTVRPLRNFFSGS